MQSIRRQKKFNVGKSSLVEKNSKILQYAMLATWGNQNNNDL